MECMSLLGMNNISRLPGNLIGQSRWTRFGSLKIIALRSNIFSKTPQLPSFSQLIKNMAKTIFLIFVAVLSPTALGNAICCESIKAQVEEKIAAKKTLCSAGSSLSSQCCKDIETEVEKHIAAYNALCSNGTSVCRALKALGMQSGEIRDDAIIASSWFSSNFKPSNGRLNRKIGSCSWATTTRGKKNSWHQVDLGRLTTVVGIATQGRCIANEWIESYVISYSADAKIWKYYEELGYKKVFRGNIDKTSIVTHSFKSPIQARYMRVWPQSWNSHPSMRVEYYSCHE